MVGQCVPLDTCGENGCPGETSDAGDAAPDAGALACTTLAENEQVNGALVLTPARIAWPNKRPPEVHYTRKAGAVGEHRRAHARDR